MNIVTKMLSAGVGLTMSAGIALAEPAIIFDLGGKFPINPSTNLHLPERSAGQMKRRISEKLNFKMKRSVNKLCVDLPKLGLTQL